ncbi:type II secretion system F family protein [Leucobacter sp. W1478]|uniref:type II secretion system F family protein n=1 Tax=Leucobacter sp. W1478 TaxID=3439065 RepID=UPI003F39D37E
MKLTRLLEAGMRLRRRVLCRDRYKTPSTSVRGTQAAAGAAGQLSAASVLGQAASLLRGGVPSSRVWAVLAADGIRPPKPEGPEWRVVLAAWRLAEESGAPFAAVLERLAEALRSLDRLAERRAVLLAGPRSTIRLVAALPLVALATGALLGFDPLPVLLSPSGAILIALGLVLLALGVWWARAIVTRLERVDYVAGLECELAWIALGGGVPPGVALRRVADCADAASAEWVQLDRLRRDGPVVAVCSAAATLGTPVGPLLLAEAEAARGRAQSDLERAAERLGVHVLLPLAICVLPSFVLLGVTPVLLSVLGGVTG